jgi:hypothetical protein
MPKTKISEWSSTPSSNTDIDGINIAEGCAPSGINDAIREMMSQVKDLYSGTTGDAISIAGGGTGGTTAVAARTNLGLVIGTDVQAADSELTTLAGMSASRATFLASSEAFGFRNRIINGAMMIDQRNAGASVTNVSGSSFSADRFELYGNVASKFTGQQNAGSVTPPVGYSKYLGITSLSAYTVAATDRFAVVQKIEGFNTQDFNWGTANATTVTLTFWVRSSLTGTFGGAFRNGGTPTPSYPFTYTISAANTWEQKSITVAGPTTGTWATDNTSSLQIWFNLGTGSTFSGPAGSWAATDYSSATGATSVVGTNGATFYITGVQLEKGSTATPFDYRPYGTELALCQRYYQTSSAGAVVDNYPGFHYGTSGYCGIVLPVTMRVSPTVTATGLGTTWFEAGNSYPQSLVLAAGTSNQTISLQVSITGGTSGYAGTMKPLYQASAEL